MTATSRLILCDLGFGEPELGYVLCSELESIRIKVGAYELQLERDLWFEGKKPISEYADEAAHARRIVT